MSDNKTPQLVILEELLTVFEQNNDFDEEREEEAYAQYAWEKDFDKSWEQLVDKDGVLQYVQPQNHYFSGQTQDLHDQNLSWKNYIQKRGIVRNLVIIFDAGEHMRETDFKPDRLYSAFGALKGFIRELFHQGPITQIALILLRDKEAILVGQLGTNPSEQLEHFGNIIKEGAQGAISLQNGLEMSLTMLANSPSYTTREVLVIFGSTRTLDAGNILITIENLKNDHICVNGISLSPEMYVLKHMCNVTGGTFSVALDSCHLWVLLAEYTIPPKWKSWMEPVLTKVGFPPYEKTNIASLCVCHSKLTYKAYICPQCHSKCCNIPSKCKCCGLYLVSPPDVARTFYHLVPPKSFIEHIKQVVCFSCNLSTNKGRYCVDCKYFYCQWCDEYIHNELHTCPSCLFGKHKHAILN